RGWRLPAELRHESRSVIAVAREVGLVPHVPHMHAALRIRVRRHRLRAAIGTAGPIGPGWVEFGHDRWEELEVEGCAPGAPLQGVGPSPVPEPPDILIVAVPDGEAWVAHYARHIVPRFCRNLVVEQVFGVRRTGEEKVLPDE